MADFNLLVKAMGGDQAAPGQTLPLDWTLTGTDVGATAETTVERNGVQTDGYLLTATLAWYAVSDDASYSLGTCVQARNGDDSAVTAGSPVVCHWIDTEGNTATKVTASTLTNEEWEGLTHGSGTPIAAVVDASALGLAQAQAAAAAE